MPKVKVFNMAGESVGTLTLKDEVFAVEENLPLIHEVVVAYNANQRQGTKSALTRSEVRGHAKKPWKQKHTGHARQGSTKGPQFIGGGVVFAPKPRDFSEKINKKMRDIAFASAISQKIRQNEVVVLDKLTFEGKTKEMSNLLKTFDLKKRTIFVTAENDEVVNRVANNIQKVSVAEARLLNVCDIVENTNVVFTLDAIKKIEEAYV